MTDSHPRQFELLAQPVVYQGFFQMQRYRLKHTLFQGSWTGEFEREILERGHASAVLPYDPARDELVLIEQFRPGAVAEAEGPWLVEVVAGMIEPGETAESVAHREAVEEAGLTVQALLPIHEFLVSPGGSSERIMLYLGRVDARETAGFHGLNEEHEDILVHVLPTDEALAWLDQGRIRSAVPIIALQWFTLNRDFIRQQWGGDTGLPKP